MMLYYVLLYNIYIRHAGDIYGNACLTIVNQFHNIRDFSIVKIAEIANVSTSTISRLAKELEYASFNDFSSHLDQIHNGYLSESLLISSKSKKTENLITAYNEMLKTELDRLVEEIDLDVLEQIVETICSSKRVIFCGFPTPQNIHLLQMELGVHKIETVAYSYPSDQYRVMKNSTNDDVILIYDLSTNESLLPYLSSHQNNKAKIVLITCQKSRARLVKADYVLAFDNSNLSYSIFLANTLTEYIRILTQKYN